MTARASEVDLRRDAVIYRRLLRYAKPHKAPVAVAITGMLLLASTAPALSAYFKWLMDGGFVVRDPFVIFWAPFAIIGIIGVRAVANFMAHYGVDLVGRALTFDIRQAVFAHVMRLPGEYHDTNPSAGMIAKLIFNVEQIGRSITEATISLVRDGVTIALTGAWMLYLNWKLTLMFALMLPISSYVMRIMTRRFRRASTEIQRNIGEISQVAQEAIEGYRIVKAFNAEDTELAAFRRANERHAKQVLKKAKTGAAGVSLLQLIASVAFAVVIAFALHIQMTAGDFGAYFAAVLLMMAPTKNLAKVNEIVQKALAAAESAFELLDQAAEIDSGSTRLETVQGRVEYRGVGFRYVTADVPALHDISFTAEPGQTVALVGASGSGKTTIASLLPRFYRVTEGEIRVDGININDVGLAALRSHIAIVGQDTMLFNDSIRNNIAYGATGPIDEARLEAAARSAHVLEFARTLPDGLNAPVGERGTRLSGGQRQRVAIARALYKDAPILILDEATSALDAESERYVQDAMQLLRANRTTLVIAHRLSTIERADRIVVLARGRVVESGTHQELLARNGVYAGLYRQQFAEA